MQKTSMQTPSPNRSFNNEKVVLAKLACRKEELRDKQLERSDISARDALGIDISKEKNICNDQ